MQGVSLMTEGKDITKIVYLVLGIFVALIALFLGYIIGNVVG